MKNNDIAARCVNRCAVFIRFKQPYIHWAKGLNQGDEVLPDADPLSGQVYLLSGDDEMLLEELLEANWQAIFEHELLGWSLDPKTWPADRTLELFHSWFDVGGAELVFDLDRTRLTYLQTA